MHLTVSLARAGGVLLSQRAVWGGSGGVLRAGHGLPGPRRAGAHAGASQRPCPSTGPRVGTSQVQPRGPAAVHAGSSCRTSVVRLSCHRTCASRLWPHPRTPAWQAGGCHAVTTQMCAAQGRLLMLQARGGRLHLVAEKDVPGSVYTLSAFQVRPLIVAHVGLTRLKRWCHCCGFSGIRTEARI